MMMMMMSEDILPAPINVQLRRTSSTAIEVSWDAPLHQNVVGYRIYYHTSESADVADWQSVEIGPFTVTEVGGLAPNTVYAFRVRAKAADGRYGNFSRVAMFRHRDTGTYGTKDHHLHRHLFAQSITVTMSNTAERQLGGIVRQQWVKH